MKHREALKISRFFSQLNPLSENAVTIF